MEMMKLIKSKNTPILLFIFISIFEPPFLPVQLIYIQGIIELIYLLFFRILKYKRIDLNVPQKSGIENYYGFMMLLWGMLSLSRVADIIFFNGELSFSNWIKSTNQFIVLTLIELINVIIILSYFQKNKYSLDYLIKSIINAGTLQGLFSLLAFLIPPLRMAFLKFAGDIYTNSWVLERRGYGFSQSLLDGFGYGMGLIAGLLILRFKFDSVKHIFNQCIKLFLITFSILVNSRTGLIILLLAVLLKLTVSNSIKITLIKLPIVIIILYMFMHFLVPLVNSGMASSNVNVSWIASDIGGLIKSIIPSANINTTLVQAQSTNNAYFTSITNIQLPNNAYQFLFGKGWQVYEGSSLGYRSDNGYVNMFWMVGVVGTIAYYLYNLFISIKLFNKISKEYYIILIFNYIALLTYSVKGRPIGYSSGIVVFYILIFSISFYGMVVSKREDN